MSVNSESQQINQKYLMNKNVSLT